MQKPRPETVCPICFADRSTHQTLGNWFWNRDCLCGNCRSMFIPAECSFQLGELSIYALYHYEENIENLLYQYKENRDIALADIFVALYAAKITGKYRGYTLVGMPSSDDKTAERGFHHLERMLKTIHLPYVDLFEKDTAYKQSLRNGEQRKEITAHMRIREHAVIPNTPLLLIDDVCTTGSTLKHAYQLLDKHIMDRKALVLSVHEKCLLIPHTKKQRHRFTKEGRKKE